jgi:putative tricarboxylic transport membrane protein
VNRLLTHRAAVALILAGCGVVWVAVGYGVWDGIAPGAGFFPTVSGGLLVFFAAIAIITDQGNSAAVDVDVVDDDVPSWSHLLGYVAALVGFALLLEPIGAIPAILLLFTWILLMVERLPLKLVILVTAGSAFGVWFLFDYLLNITLPRGPLG